MGTEFMKIKYENSILKRSAHYSSMKFNALKQEKEILEKEKNIIEEENKRFKENFNTIVQAEVEKAIKIIEQKYENIINELQQEIEKLKSQANTNSSNSSLPPSKNKINTKITNLRESTDKNKGGQKNHKRYILEPLKEDEITETVEHTISECNECNGKLVYLKTLTSDIIDFDVVVKKTRNNIYQYKCNCCKKIIKANEKLPLGVLYGNNVNSTAISLLNDSNVPYNKIVKHISGISNEEINMSEGYVVKLQKRAAQNLLPFEEELKNQIIKEQIVHTDDTAINIGKKKGYLRFYGNEKLALIIGHENKTKEGYDDDKILVNLSNDTTLIHDHILYFYNEKFQFKNAECNAHILRYLKSVNENIHTHNWSMKLSELLSTVNKNRIGKVAFSKEYIDEVYKKYDDIIKLGYQELELLPKYHFYLEKESLLLKRLDKFRTHHLLFVEDFKVAFTNNTAEKSFRISKTKMKVSGLFQNIESAKNYARILSYMETCYRNGINKLEAIKRLLDGNPYTVKELLNEK